jgi:DNA end-binding protein Ku
MSRAIAKPMISIGLLNVPIRIESIARTHDISFKYVCPECKTDNIHQKHYCSACDKDYLTTTQFLKGFRTADSLKVFSKEQIQNFESSGKIEIVGIVPSGEIPFYLVEKTYGITPNKELDKNNEIFNLFYESVVENGYIAIGTYTMRNKQHKIAIIPHSERLFMAILHYPDEIDMQNKIEVKESKKENKELLKMLLSKIEKPSIDSIDVQDERIEAIIQAIEQGTEIKIAEKPTSNIAEALKASIKAI